MSFADSGTITIRNGWAADHAALVEMDPERATFLRSALELGDCVVAEVDGKRVGCVVLDYSFFGFGFIPLIVVAAAYRQRGVALQLLSAVQQRCRSAKLFASANASNSAAQALFRRAGFVRSGTVENLDDGDPEIIFFKSA